MRYEDAISTETPEGLALELTLAGVGSRFTAAIVDAFIQFGVLFVILITIGLLQNNVIAAIGGIASFLWFMGYDIAFETRASGRTPGKRWTGLRVVRVDGRPVDFRSSAVRNFLRIVDILPTFYLVAIVTIFISRKNQRLGDMAAGTIVVREKKGEADFVPFVPEQFVTDDLATWDVSRVSAADIATVRQFLERRSGIEAAARQRVARELARRLWPNVVGPSEGIAPERFLEQLVAAKAARSL
jgi:uncharacterized RDD family membrane protein YckC